MFGSTDFQQKEYEKSKSRRFRELRKKRSDDFSSLGEYEDMDID
jgi:hypothetical protein